MIQVFLLRRQSSHAMREVELVALPRHLLPWNSIGAESSRFCERWSKIIIDQKEALEMVGFPLPAKGSTLDL